MPDTHHTSDPAVRRRRRVALLAGLIAAVLPAVVQSAEIGVERDVAVPMSDGTILRANIFRPPGDGPFPVLLMRTPYGKPETMDESLVRAGFVVVVQDVRGRFASDGKFESFLRADTHDANDGHDTVEWAAKLPGSNGKVGLFGASYPAFLAWRAAAKKPKSLAALAAFSIPASYLDLEQPGTIRPVRVKWWHGLSADLRRKAGGPPPHTSAEAASEWSAGAGDKLLRTLPWSGLPDDLFGGEADAAKTWLKDPARDPWQLDRDAAAAMVPNLNVCGWYDHCLGSIDLHRVISTKGGSFNAKRFSRIVIGPWTHGVLGMRHQGDVDFGPAAEVDLIRLQAEWFAQWLNSSRPPERAAPIRLFVMGANEWRNFYDWPPRYASPREWFLDSDGAANTPAGDGRLSPQPPARATADRFDYDPRNPVPTVWATPFVTAPTDQKPLAARKDVLVYQSPPLASDVEVIGYPDVALQAESDRPDTDFFARLIDVSPDGRAIPVAAGMVRARYREGIDKPKLLASGEVVEFRIRMRPTAHRFLTGHRVRLDVTSSDFPNFDRNHNTAADQNSDAELATARQTIHHGGERKSRLILPVMRPKSDEPAWAVGATTLPPPRFVKQWGKLGDGPGELHSPIGIAIDARDRVYVTEFHNKRVQVFDVEGQNLRTMAVESQPGGIAVDAQGRVYVALMLEHKVVAFDSEGKRAGEWGKAGAGDGEFNQPGGISMAKDGTIYVVDQANHRIQFFAPDGKFLGKWGEHGTAAGQFGGDGPKGSRLSGPHFAAFDAEGRLYVTEGATLRVQRFDASGKPLSAWTGIGEGPGGWGGRPADRTNPFEGPIGVVVDRKGRVWISSTNNRIQCFSSDGKFLTGLGDEGAEPGEFIIPHAMAVDSRGFLYVVDSSNQRVQKFAIDSE